MSDPERNRRRRILRCIIRTLRRGTLPRIVLKLVPPITLGWPPFYYGDYDRDEDVMRVWVGEGFEDTCWHEAVHAAEARLGLRHNEPRAEALARYFCRTYVLPDLRETHRCPSCGAGVYVGLERCRSCGEALAWPERIPVRRDD
jgi:hypothetical protein